MKRIIALTVIIMAASIICVGNAKEAELNDSDNAINLMKPKEYKSYGEILRYRLYLPSNFDKSKKYPLVLLLHGAGERGNDNKSQLRHGAGEILAYSRKYNIPIWGFHGDKDKVVKTKRSRDMVAAIIKAGGNKIKYTELKNCGHGAWSAMYSDTTHLKWLFDQKKD